MATAIDYTVPAAVPRPPRYTLSADDTAAIRTALAAHGPATWVPFPALHGAAALVLADQWATGDLVQHYGRCGEYDSRVIPGLCEMLGGTFSRKPTYARLTALAEPYDRKTVAKVAGDVLGQLAGYHTATAPCTEELRAVIAELCRTADALDACPLPATQTAADAA